MVVSREGGCTRSRVRVILARGEDHSTECTIRTGGTPDPGVHATLGSYGSQCEPADRAACDVACRTAACRRDRGGTGRQGYRGQAPSPCIADGPRVVPRRSPVARDLRVRGTRPHLGRVAMRTVRNVPDRVPAHRRRACCGRLRFAPDRAAAAHHGAAANCSRWQATEPSCTSGSCRASSRTTSSWFSAPSLAEVAPFQASAETAVNNPPRRVHRAHW